MADEFCFCCDKKFVRLSIRVEQKLLEKEKLEIPKEMSKNDKICFSCYSMIRQGLTLEFERTSNKRQAEESAQLDSRIATYMDKLNKYGVLVYKNENIAIAKRTEGNIGPFMIIFDDLTKDGYELKSVEDIMEAPPGSGQQKTGAYFYFQKMEFVR